MLSSWTFDCIFTPCPAEKKEWWRRLVCSQQPAMVNPCLFHIILYCSRYFALGFLIGNMIIIYNSKFSPSILMLMSMLMLILILMLITVWGVWSSKNNYEYFCLYSYFCLLSCLFSVKWFLFPLTVSLLSSTSQPFYHACWTTREFFQTSLWDTTRFVCMYLIIFLVSTK